MVTATAQVGTSAVTGSTGYTIGASSLTMSAITLDTGSTPATALSAFGTAGVTVYVCSGSGAGSGGCATGSPISSPQVVTFSSPCAASGAAVLTSSVTTVNGVATASYRDSGCGNSDVITASLSGLSTSQSATIYITAPAAGSIQFVSADPTNISLKGSGGTTTSQVQFKVVTSANTPISGKTVTFGLSTTVGGITLASATGISGGDGTVVAVVNSGTVSTPVRVTASTCSTNDSPCTGTTLTTQSSALSITTGIPDDAGFTIAATKINIDGFTRDGETTVITARLADHFKNPVPDNTAVNFTSEGGSINGTCYTVAGACSATLTSQGQRPADGRVTVLAYAVGEETFTDLNGNGVADLVSFGGANEMIDVNGATTDLGEAYVDYNESGTRNPLTEPFIDFNQDGLYTAADGQYSGVLCDNATPPPTGSSAGTCATSKTMHVRSALVIVFSEGQAAAQITIPAIPSLAGEAIQSFNVTVADVNGNPMPVGTTVNFTTTNGSILSTASYIVPNTTSPSVIPVTLKGDTTSSTGIFNVKVVTPNAIETNASASVVD